MGIDWFTATAQVINFLVLVGLLTYFLYRPITRAMAEREERIASRLQEAAERKAEAERTAEEYQARLAGWEKERNQRLSEVRTEVENRREELVNQTRADVDAARERWMESIRREQQQFLRHVRESISQTLTDVTRRVLMDLADTELEAQIVERFLHEMEESALAPLEGDNEAVVLTRFPLDDDHRHRVAEAVRSLAPSSSVRFEESDEVICGIVVHFQSHRIGWDVADYLDDLGDRLMSELTYPTEKKDGC